MCEVPRSQTKANHRGIEHALYPLGYNPREHKGYVCGQHMEGRPYKVVRNRKGYNAILEQEALKRREYMEQVIESRQGTGTKVNPAEATP